MNKIHVDKPIESLEEDVLGREKFILNLVDNIKSYSDNESLTIGLYGEWGSGKTSIINITSKLLEKEKFKVIHFNPWNFKGQDELIQCFFKEFYNQLDMVNYHKLFSKLGNFFKKIWHIITLGKYVPKISEYATIIAPLIKDYGETLENLTYEKSLIKVKRKISAKLKKLKRKIVIFIDDVDRLNDLEICQIFQLVKLLGNFENVVYVLSMDKDVVVSALKNAQQEHAERYLEKIVQLPINLPKVSLLKIQNVLTNNINSFVVDLKNFLPSRNVDLSQTGFWYQFLTLRDVNRFLNVFKLKFKPLKYDVDMHDFCIITLLEIKFPEVYNYIYKNKGVLCGEFYPLGNNDREKKKLKQNIESFIDTLKGKYSEENISFVNEALNFLFPKISQATNAFRVYSNYHYKEAHMRGMLYVKENFDNYFHFDIVDKLYQKSDIEDIMETYNKQEFIEFITNLNINKQLSNFLPFVIYHLEHKLNKKRCLNILQWLMEFSDNLQNEQVEYNAFSIDCEKQIAYMLKDYLRKENNKTEILSFMKTIYKNGKINATKVELLRSLESDIKRQKENSDEKPILTQNELLEIYNIIKQDLELFVCNEDNFDKNDYVQYYYLLKSINPQACKNLVEKILQEEINVLSFIKNFCTHGQYLTGTADKTFGFRLDLGKEIDLEKVYNIFMKDFDPNLNLDEDNNLYKVTYLMFYENKRDVDNDTQYTKKALLNFLENKKD